MAVIKAILWSHLGLSKTNWRSPWGSYDPRRHYESPGTLSCQALPSWCHQCWCCQVLYILLQGPRLWLPNPMKWCIGTAHPSWGVSRRSYLAQMLISWPQSAWFPWMGVKTIGIVWIPLGIQHDFCQILHPTCFLQVFKGLQASLQVSCRRFTLHTIVPETWHMLLQA